MTRIFLVDDHQIVREGIKHFLKALDDTLVIAGEASEGRQAIRAILADTWDLVILDVSMPGLDGLEVLRRIRQHKPELPVLILTMHDDMLLALRYMKAGASGYITKDSAPELLLQAIRQIVKGGKYMNQALSERLLDKWKRDTHENLHDKLSDREYTIFLRIAAGASMSAIADELSLSYHTVRTYRNRIFSKMDMDNTAQLTRYALKSGLIS